ncbi:polysaccharide lyase family 8 super-sandwich domain-containing protein [Clostridium sp. AL.422]|uniref:polysaccharide lyase family 8 super-sandwich domain-containing protein n=1 Tax=Clostridium TaxID=1485 RepID=UPI00293DB889|nr:MULTISPECIES: polysaccharide lyase family 8 super-sandwich domain-containing protein [unclassified Clostridium]MDV4150446.1 polysaccharide lyase family 8 super-sandwich domain-containing protein [Clostridium sp. AL.422]
MNNGFITGVALLLSTTYMAPMAINNVNFSSLNSKISTVMTSITDTAKVTDDFSIIKNNYKLFLIGNEESNSNPLVNKKISNIIKNGKSALDAYVKSGDTLFSNIPLDNQETSTNIYNSYVKLYDMALVYSTPAGSNSYYKNEDVKNKIIDGLQWLYDNYFSDTNSGYYGNWFNWEIGIPQNLTKTLMLLEEEINSAKPELITSYVDIMDNYIRGGIKEGNTGEDIDLTNRFHTGANLADIAFNRIIQGTLIKDEERIAKAVSNMMTVYETIDPNNIKNGVTDGFYEDGSFIQHHRVAYTGSYGKGLLQRCMQAISTLNNTKWKDETLVDKMSTWVYEAFAPIMYEGYIMEIVKGRALSRVNTGFADPVILEAMTQLSEALGNQDGQILKSYIKYINQTASAIDTSGFTSFKAIIDYDSIIKDEKIIPENAVESSKHYAFNSMDKIVHARENYSFALSRSSNRIAKYEYMSGENLKPWFQGDGAFYLYQSGNDQNNLFGANYYATINPYRLPGTTTPNEVRKTIPELYGRLWYENPGHELNFTSSSTSQNDYVYFPVGTNNYSGGTTLDEYGISAMQLGDDNAYKDKQAGILPEDFVVYKNSNANKSWFMFDDEIVVLGSNISDDLKREVTTTIDNPMSLQTENITLQGKSKSSDDILNLVNGKYEDLDWISYSSDSSNSNVGYYFPTSKEITLNKELRTGNLRDSRTSNPDKEVTTQFTTLTYEHGADPQKDSYSYVILPDFDSEKTNAYAKNPKINILENKDSVHAVEQTELNIKGYNFFNNEETTVGNVTSYNQASLMLRQEGKTIKLSVSDPTFDLETIHLSLNIPNAKLVSSDEEISTTINEAGIDIIVNTAAANGSTFEATFEIDTLGELKEIISEAKGLNENDYTATSWNNMITALTVAENIPNDASQDVIDKAISDLRKAISNLEKVSRKEILELIKKAEKISSKDYTKESFDAFEVALNNARKVNENRDSKQKEIDDAVLQLQASIDKLVLKDKDNGNDDSDDKGSPNDNGNLPKTGGTSTAVLSGIAALLLGAGAVLRKRK